MYFRFIQQWHLYSQWISINSNVIGVPVSFTYKWILWSFIHWNISFSCKMKTFFTWKMTVLVGNTVLHVKHIQCALLPVRWHAEIKWWSSTVYLVKFLWRLRTPVAVFSFSNNKLCWVNIETSSLRCHHGKEWHGFKSSERGGHSNPPP
jgi:hypothetical protein